MLVTTAIVAGSLRKVPSDSSASATIQSPLPRRALEPQALMMPPMITVGSIPALSSSWAMSDVVVVLPWVPPTAIDHFRRISSPSISARRTTGIRRLRAAMTSTLSGLTADEATTTWASPRLSARWPTVTGIPTSRRRRTLALSARSLPCTEYPRLWSTSAMPLMPMPPLPTKCTVPMVSGSAFMPPPSRHQHHRLATAGKPCRPGVPWHRAVRRHAHRPPPSPRSPAGREGSPGVPPGRRG